MRSQLVLRLAALAVLILAASGCNDDAVAFPFGDAADAGSTTDAATLDDVGIVPDGGSPDGDAGVVLRPDTGETPEACDPAERDNAPAATLTLYVDGDETDRSVYDSAPTPGDVPISDREATLIGANGETAVATCDDGVAAVGGLEPGYYVWTTGLTDDELCRTRNCPRRFAAAVAEGRVKIVTAGDSVPVIGATTQFPDRLASLLGGLATVESENVAVPGSVSSEWVPGTNYFEQRIAPNLADTDVFILSLGGNDMLSYANEAFGTGDIQGAIDGFPDYIREVQGRILLIKDQVRLANPDADLVYLLYPDYAQSSVWEEQFGFALPLIAPLVTQALEQILDEIAVEEDIVIADLFGYFNESGEEIGDYMADQLHFTDAGHQIIAEVIFRALGGVTIEESTIAGADAWIGVAP